MSPKTHLTVLHGPYVVDYTDFPSSGGGTVNLFTPTVGDVLLRAFPDFQAAINFAGSIDYIAMKQGIYTIVAAQTGNSNQAGGNGRLDNIPDSVDFSGNSFAANLYNTSYLPNPVYTSAFVFHTNDPVLLEWQPNTAGSDRSLSNGHMELYFLIAHPI